MELSLLWLLGLCLSSSALALAAASLLQARMVRPRSAQLTEDPGQAIFLFDGDRLLDASAGARLILAGTRDLGTDLARFLDWAEPRFEGLRLGLDNLCRLGALRTGSDGMTLLAEWRSGIMRITVQEPHLDPPFRNVDQLSERSREEELSTLRQLVEDAPLPIWSEDADHRVVWVNRAYLELAGAEDGDPIWPLPQLFADRGASGRVKLSHGGDLLWFECHQHEIGELRHCYAVPAQATVQAERAHAALLQTLTRTFSYLPIGLAMFDRQRRLHLFNPALTDLTTLPAGFLSARPSLNSFLDQMRERGMIPEPNDYQAWRGRIAALEETGTAPDFEEIWSLQSGLTYRVAVRPHPEGSLALLVQDISDEVASTRRLKTDLELGQSVLDASSEAMAIFAASGQIVMSNRSYRQLWGEDISHSLRNLSIRDLLPRWRAESAATPFWAEVEAFVGCSGPRLASEAEIRLLDGRLATARLVPLAGGASLVGFTPDEDISLPQGLAVRQTA